MEGGARDGRCHRRRAVPRRAAGRRPAASSRRRHGRGGGLQRKVSGTGGGGVYTRPYRSMYRCRPPRPLAADMSASFPPPQPLRPAAVRLGAARCGQPAALGCVLREPRCEGAEGTAGSCRAVCRSSAFPLVRSRTAGSALCADSFLSLSQHTLEAEKLPHVGVPYV